MLTAVHIKRFRSCQDVTLSNIENLLVLIGRNGAGKSNILKAIAWVAKKLSNKNKAEEESSRFKEDDAEIKLNFKLNGTLYQYDVVFMTKYGFLHGSVEPEFEIVFKESLSQVIDGVDTKLVIRDGESIKIPALNDVEFAVSREISSIKAIQSLLPEENSFKALLESISEFFSNVIYYPLELSGAVESSPFITQDQYQKWFKNSIQIKDSELLLQLKILHLYLTDKEKFDELSSLIGDDGLAIISHINIVSYGPINENIEGISEINHKFHIVGFLPAGHTGPASFRLADLSFGTKRILHFVTSLIYDSASVALVEQIEDGIHEGLVDKLIQLVRSYSDNSQFILASHSTAVFNRLKPAEIRVVELSESVTTARALSATEITSAISYMRNEGSFSDFLQSV